MPEDFATRGTDIAKLESSVKNKFKWAWLEEKDGGGEFLSNYVRKLNSPGLAYCLHCKQRLDYSKKGKLAIKRHADSANHKKNAKAVRQTQSLPTIFKGLASLESGEKTVPSAIPYGAAPNVPDCAASFSSTDISSKQVPVDPCPSFKDRVAHQEAMICSFIAEHSLPLSLAPSLIKLAQSLSIDHKALESLSMERQTMTYKMKHGLHEVERKRLIKQLQSTPFSINVDESTAKHNKKRVLNVLVCFFDKNLGKSVTHLYAAIELTVVNASTVYTAVKSKLESDAIPLDNLISCLSDSAAYMRGSESGFQARLKTDAPHLLDIDGDICHHIHNISKHFCQKLDPSNHLAHLLDDIHRDFMFSPDIREDFTSICKILGVKCQQPKERVGHRWLSMLDSSIPLHELMDPLTVMYYAWLTHSDKELYKDTYTAILKEKCVSPAGRQTIMEILRKLRGKNMTQLGKQRKARIYSKLFDKRKETDLVLSCMLSVLPMFKEFILLFEHNTPMLHKIHDRMLDISCDFLKLFVRAELIRESGKHLATINLDEKQNLIPAAHIECGRCSPILTTLPEREATNFRERLLAAYTSTAIYMLKKLPLTNTSLKTLSLLDPLAFGQTNTAILLKKLPSLFPTISAPSFDTEIMRMQSDTDITTGSNMALDLWWAAVFKLKRYPSVENIVTACLSIFTGPKVESSFSMMNNIISENAPSMMISTYEAVLSIKYNLLAKGTTTIKHYHRADAVRSPVDQSLAFHMQTAYKRHTALITKLKTERAEKDKTLGLCSTPQLKKKQGMKRKGTHLGMSCPPKRAK